MRNERLFQLAGIVIFLIITSLTYFTLIPVNNTNVTTNTTANPQGDVSTDVSTITIVYRISTSIVSGVVVSLLAVFFLKSSKTEALNKLTSAKPNK